MTPPMHARQQGSRSWKGCGRSEATLLVLCSRSAHDQNVLARRAQWDQQGWPHSGMVVDKKKCAQWRTKPGRSSGEGKRASVDLLHLECSLAGKTSPFGHVAPTGPFRRTIAAPASLLLDRPSTLLLKKYIDSCVMRSP